ncbi:hypothetical protein TVAG_198720 [Trichomonas vaginalis G3]|uniref:Uncharacterized protein n=1 Tax=Trichomonas vaginalis (strain ATCC PRA-98 / G3) TaxID=412133 RepID=A2DDQ7_TRIV3|nr:general transcription factor IIF subunit 2 family [Trichomonas vaginalis G3]EAY21433.1 hypothetical protein TVAG_198720 [Trichomonas vaginalis G3]KAI5490646.1 general transcription factor IIF subunit 2 family [Trichomonas vaginalis G3]|eukprot:XP_001582419.1 hypothetical protein [Trichomonas vaginalis G3]
MYVKKEDIPKPITEAPQYSILDTTKSNEPAYLVRIPEFIYETFKATNQSGQIGTITINHMPGGKEEFVIQLTNGLPYTVPVEMLPSNYRVEMDKQSRLTSQYLFTSTTETGYVRIAGKISNTGHLLSDEKDKFRNCSSYKQDIARNEKKEKKKSKIVEPSSEAKIEARHVATNKRETKEKNMRLSVDDLRARIFEQFKRSDEWSIQDLVKVIQQDQGYIADVIRNIANYDSTTKTYRLKDAYKNL